jgi:crotonyl-CoA carboxylase/reductase
VLWRTLTFESLPEAHQLLYQNRHLGKISLLVGASDEHEGKTAAGPDAIRIDSG